MNEPSSHDTSDIAAELFDLIPRLLGRIRADIPRDTDNIAPEWRDILELRTTIASLAGERYPHRSAIIMFVWYALE